MEVIRKLSFVWWFIWFFRNRVIFNDEGISSRHASFQINNFFTQWSKVDSEEGDFSSASYSSPK